MRRFIALAMMLAVLCSFCGCQTQSDKVAELTGTWETVGYFSAESVEELLVSLDLYEEEIALLDMGSMGIVDVIRFSEDKTYTITTDVDKTLALVEAYYRDAFATLYANRDKLAACYEDDLMPMSEEAFYQYYAAMYGVMNFDALIDTFVYSTTDAEVLTEDTENGTFRIFGPKIYFTMEGTDVEEYVDYTISGDTLSISYEDGVVEYTKG